MEIEKAVLTHPLKRRSPFDEVYCSCRAEESF
jgi:hypothetical protein